MSLTIKIQQLKQFFIKTEEEERLNTDIKNHKTYTILFSILSGLIYVTLFWFLAFSHWDPYRYVDRDDAVISFSHAVNWKDYGFIGVSPSGERVEGYSTPVHFILYFIFYALFHVGFSTYVSWQTTICSFLLGYIFFKFFKDKPSIIGIVGSIVSAFLLSSATRFLEWHASGMENPLSEVLILLSIYLLYKSVKERDIKYYYAFAFATASLSRIESIYYIFPLLVVALLLSWEYSYRNKVIGVILLTLALLVVVSAMRIWYFGSFEPNTSVAQHLDLKDQIIKTITFDKKYWKHSFGLTRGILMLNLGVFLVVGLILYWYSRRSPSQLYLMLAGFTMLFLTALHTFIFKGERLDIVRYGTHLAPVAVTSFLFFLVHFKRSYYKHLFYVAPVVLVTTIVVLAVTRVRADWICCATQYFEYNKSFFLKLKETNKIVRPTVATADLGITSYTKDFNIADFAFLGSPVLAKLYSSEILLRTYILQVLRPDILETHHNWTCNFQNLLNDSLFIKQYKFNTSLYSTCPSPGIYIRKDIEINSISKERMFYDKLRSIIIAPQINKDSLTTLLRKEIAANRADSSIYGSMYIGRTLFKFLPELREAGLLDVVLAELKNNSTSEYDMAWLTSDRDSHWRDKVVKAFVKYYVYDNYSTIYPPSKSLLQSDEISTLFNSKYLKAEKEYKIYYNKNILLYYGNSNQKSDLSSRFYLRITPENINDLAQEEIARGFSEKFFKFKYKGLKLEDEYVMPIELPAYKIKKIETGQFAGNDTLQLKAPDILWSAIIK